MSNRILKWLYPVIFLLLAIQVSSGSNPSVHDHFEAAKHDSMISNDFTETPISSDLIKDYFLINGNGDDWIIDMSWDSNNDLILIGCTTSDDLPFNNSYVGAGDVFIVKLDQEKEIIWARYFGGSGLDYELKRISGIEPAVAMVIDEEDNIIIGGTTSSNDLPMVSSMNASYQGGHSDGFLAKYSSSGDLLWSTYIGGTGEDYVTDLLIDDGVIYALGMTNREQLFGSSYTSFQNYFILKLNGSGEYVDSFVSDKEFNFYMYSFCIDSSKSIVISGEDFTSGLIILLKLDSEFNEFFFKVLTGRSSTHNQGLYVVTNEFDQILMVGRIDINLANAERARMHGFLMMLSPKGEELWSYEPLGSEDEADFEKAIFDEKGNIIIIGEIINEEFEDEFVKNSYLKPESRKSYRVNFMMKMSLTGELLWSNIISYGVHNQEEHGNNDLKLLTQNSNGTVYFGGSIMGTYNSLQMTNFSVPADSGFNAYFATIPDPLDDEDNDFISNVYEYTHSMNLWDPADAQEDLDGDGLISIIEQRLTHTHPRDNDTDDDLLDDGFEVINYLDPLDAMGDRDRDSLTDADEYFIHHTSFSSKDTDYDGLSDGDEILIYGTEALNKFGDLDKDGLLDYEEINVYFTNHQEKDTDHDGISDYDEVNYGTDPNDPYDNKILNYSKIIVSILLTLFFIIAMYKLNSKIKNNGFSNLPQYMQLRHNGFNTYTEYCTAKDDGFENKHLQNLITSAGYQTLDDFNFFLKEIMAHDPVSRYQKENAEVLSIFSSSESPEQSIYGLEKSTSLLNGLNEQRIKLEALMALLSSIQSQFSSRLLQKMLLNKKTLLENKNMLSDQRNSLIQMQNNLKKAINDQTNWFEPWDRLLTLIEITGDAQSISIERIASVVALQEWHAAELIQLLIKNNPMIGEYDSEKQVFTKGLNVERYLVFAKNLVKKIETA
ncbi:MAG: hypothetical protein INQ03_14480 [Candidatus Heimdallarchaeota archaeon]|nr:hypothetical protein [Candidatus Heimdallarchaeota archaeon]